MRDRFPVLFSAEPQCRGPIRSLFEAADEAPLANLIGNVNVVPFIGDQWVLIRLGNGRVELPGGTLEPNESYVEAAKRELLEEAGAQISKLRVIGWWRCESSNPLPYREHLPHPNFLRVVTLAEASLVQPPSNPEGGENVVAVEIVSAETAQRAFADQGREDLAEIYRFAEHCRSIGQ